MKSWLGILALAAANVYGAAGPLVAAASAPGARVPPGVAYLGNVGGSALYCGAGAAAMGRVILPDARGRSYYRVEGARGADLSSFGEVLWSDGADVLLCRRYGFVYGRPMAALPYPWRELRPIDGRPGGRVAPVAPAADGRVQYLLGRIKEEDVESDLAALTAFPTRYSYSPYLDDAAAWLYGRFRDFGLSPRYDVFITAHDFDSCWFLPGTETGWVVGASGLILHTDDGGLSWDIAPSGTDDELVDVYFADADHGWIVGANGTVLRTVDGGASWQRQPKPTDRHLTGVCFVDAVEGWACGTGGVILHTTDGGASWEQQTSNMTDTLFELQFLDALHGYAVGWHGEVRRTDDGGVTWVRKLTPFSDPETPDRIVELTGLSFVSALEGWVVGNGFDLILHTTDGGDTWDVQRYDVAGGEYLGGVWFVDGQRGVAVGGEEGKVLRTADGGGHWQAIDTPADYPLTAVSFASDADGWACGYGACVDATADGGLSWVSRRDRLPPELGWKNVVCDVVGRDDPGQQFLVTAHYDDTSDQPQELAPGAEDNGSGVVAALAAARAFSRSSFRRTIRFVLFAGEEQGLLGSRDYARRARDRGDDIRAVWNADMVGYVGQGPDDSTFVYNDPSAWMWGDASQAQRLYVPELALTGENNPFMGASDHYSFWQQNYAAALLHENEANGTYPYYHKATDTLGKLSLPYLTANARLGAAAVATWAGLADAGPALSLDTVRVYPNPYKPARSAKPGVTFDGVPSDASLSVYDLAGRKIAAGAPDSGGVWVWDGAVASGVYVFVLEREGEKRAGKVAVVR